MDLVKRAFGYIHIILGLAVAVQFLASEIYDGDAVGQVWDILNYFMAIGVIAALVFSYLRSREADRSDMSEWIASSVMLIASAALFLLYFEQWFAWTVFKDAGDELGDSRSLVWIMIDVMFPIVNIIVGSYLLRSVGSTSD
ncbi:MAG: hypothetical protein F4Y63_11205 [Chloroflexi bacterium]|nr:hypothetical protein [Chloroflexota bacterium]MYF79588.1 hypothetical protein [Chloroflexota bacterium]MYK61410.1 hypothetical protein [Chloroflexota bacterium]